MKIELTKEQIEELSKSLERVSGDNLLSRFDSETIILVSPELDLVTAACHVAADSIEQVEDWVEKSLFSIPGQLVLSEWETSEESNFYALEMAPFVLVQKLVCN